MRWFLCAVVWLATMAVVVLVALTGWGPVVVSLSDDDSIRAGDLVVVLLGGLVAGVVTLAVWATAPVRRDASVAVRWLLIAVAWVSVMLASLYVAAATRLGPVIIPLSERHGVHVSDLLVLLLGVVVASLFTGVAWMTSPAREHDRASTPKAVGEPYPSHGR